MKKSVNAIKSEEYLVAEILSSTMDLIYLKDAEGKLIDANDYARDLFGLNEVQQWVGKNEYDLLSSLPHSMLFNLNSEVTDEQIWREQKVTRFEKELYSYKEGFKTFSITKMPFYHMNGERKTLLVVGKDITSEKNDERRLTDTIKELADFKYALDQSSIVASTDSRGRITYVNNTFCEISKYSRDELIGKDHRILNSSYHSKQFFKEMWKTISSGRCWKGEIKNKAKDGTFYWVKTTIIPFNDKEGKPYQYIAIRQDITEKKEIEEQIYQKAYYDELTGLRNRRYFREEISKSINRSKENKTAFLFLDLNRFKYINDTLGHNVGDKILQSVSKRLLQNLHRKADLYRFGGDEFIIVFQTTTREEVENFIEEVVKIFAVPFYLNTEIIYLTTSIGVSLFPKDGDDTETLIKKADSAMYLAKKKGNNKVQFYNDNLSETINRTLRLENALRHAVECGEFSLHYQPQVNLSSKEIVGIEALLRWGHPKLGMIAPSEFIPIAEETGLIFPITEWVLEEACKRNYQLQKDGLKKVRVAVNISTILLNKDLVGLVKKTLKKTKLSPCYLELEITESIMQKPDLAIPILKELKSLGICISIDDFGTGYSSLAYIRDLPIDKLKIDSSFIKEINKDDAEAAIVKMIISMASLLDVGLIAEGIETKNQCEFLIQSGCKEGQGYLFSRPIAYEKLRKLLHPRKETLFVYTTSL